MSGCNAIYSCYSQKHAQKINERQKASPGCVLGPKLIYPTFSLLFLYLSRDTKIQPNLVSKSLAVTVLEDGDLKPKCEICFSNLFFLSLAA